MDSELQYLIRVSMDKMTSGNSTALAGHESRKSLKMDLRKALLVAHFLQEVRCAYFEEDPQVFSNTLTPVPDSTTTSIDNQVQSIQYSNVQVLTVKDVNMGYTEAPYLQETGTNPCVALSDALRPSVRSNEDKVSKIAQLANPLPLSLNTNHVMSSKNLDICLSNEGENFNTTSLKQEDIPSVYEELEVSSCCEIDGCSEEQMSPVVGVTCQDCQIAVVNAFDIINGNVSLQETDVPGEHDCTTRDSSFTKVTPSITCPLPKKKRPLPKEFLNYNQITFGPSCKTFKTNLVQSINSECRVVTTEFFSSTSKPCPKSLLSKTYTSLQTVRSDIDPTSSFNSQTQEKIQPNPKVVVQRARLCDSYLPITCMQIQLEQRLGKLTDRAV